MKRLILLFAVLSLTSFKAQAVADHNSSRSNKSSSIAADLGDESEEFSKEVRTAKEAEYESGDLIKRAHQLDKKVEAIKVRMVLGTYTNILLRNLRESKCDVLRGEECLDKAIIEAERETLGKSRPGGPKKP